MNDRRFIGSGQKDETIGRLLERTEQLMNQNESFERTLGTFNQTMDSFGKTVAKLEGAVQHLSNAIDRQEAIEDRCRSAENRLDRLDAVTKKLPEIEAEVLFWRRVLGGGIHAFWKIAAFLVSSGGLGAVSMKLIEKWSGK